MHLLYGVHQGLFQILLCFLVSDSFVLSWFSIFEHLFFAYFTLSGHMNINMLIEALLTFT
jgi:hypothetical protein